MSEPIRTTARPTIAKVLFRERLKKFVIEFGDADSPVCEPALTILKLARAWRGFQLNESKTALVLTSPVFAGALDEAWRLLASLEPQVTCWLTVALPSPSKAKLRYAVELAYPDTTHLLAYPVYRHAAFMAPPHLETCKQQLSKIPLVEGVGITRDKGALRVEVDRPHGCLLEQTLWAIASTCASFETATESS